MRDLERWKDKVEVSLDGRQIFFLFFGSAVAVCVVFVSGILVGKRIEQRAFAATMPASEDPLAVLDRLGSGEEAEDGLTFHQTLMAPTGSNHATSEAKSESKVGDGKHPRPEAEPRKVARAEAAATARAAKAVDAPAPTAEAVTPAPAAPLAVVEKKPAAGDEAVKPAVKAEAAAVAAKPVAAPHAAPIAQAANPSAKPVEAKASEAKPADAKPVVRPIEARPTESKRADAKPAPVEKESPAKAAAATANSRFTLQLSAFPEKSDADQFVEKMRAAGFTPFLIHADVPGRGLFYRVRVGEFATMRAALTAKADLERRQRVIAYVARL